MQLIDFSDKHIDDAATLLGACYARERAECEHLPATPMGDSAALRDAIATTSHKGGVAAVDEGKLIGYMLVGHAFEFKGQQAALTPEIGHAAAAGLAAEIYPPMVASIAARWADGRAAVHLMGYFAHDDALHQTLSEIGFGQFLFERVRDLSPIPECEPIGAERIDDIAQLVDLEAEHFRYYRGSPIFLNKSSDRESVLGRLTRLQDQGCTFLAHRDGGELVGSFIVGSAPTTSEGLLLRNTNTAAARSAFIRPDYRRRGIGASLLNAAIACAAEEGFDRLFVEHESANILGGRFWRRHFTPYLRVGMRFVDLPAALG